MPLSFTTLIQLLLILISVYGTSNSTVIRQSTLKLCPLQMSVHYFQLLVMCNNYLLETFCDITLIVVCVGDLAIALVMRNMPTSQ